MDENKVKFIRPEEEAHDTTEGQSTPELAGQFSRDAMKLISNEIELAKSELRDKVNQIENAAKSIAIGAAVLIPGLFVATAAIVLLLATFMQPWIAAALVAIVIFAVGYVLINTGQKKMKKENVKPEATISSLRADRSVAREVMHARRKNG